MTRWLAISWLLWLPACGPSPQDIQHQALEAAALWFASAHASQTTAEASPTPDCHAFGLLKFPDVSCGEMIEHAARLDASTRQVDSVRLQECFGTGAKEVCGDFAELWFTTQDPSGADIKEGMVLKRDDGTFGVYWYRSDTLFTEITRRADRAKAQSADQQAEEQRLRLQGAYTQMVQRDPSIYQYPVCIDARISRSVMQGGLMPQDQVSGTELDRRATACSAELCLTLVGQKVAALCL